MKIVLHPTKETILDSITSEVKLVNYNIQKICSEDDIIRIIPFNYLSFTAANVKYEYVLGGHLTLTPKESILSLVHNKVNFLRGE